MVLPLLLAVVLNAMADAKVNNLVVVGGDGIAALAIAHNTDDDDDDDEVVVADIDRILPSWQLIPQQLLPTAIVTTTAAAATVDVTSPGLSVPMNLMEVVDVKDAFSLLPVCVDVFVENNYLQL